MLNKLLLIILMAFIVGCGFKGPLYVPDKNASNTESGSHFTYD